MRALVVDDDTTSCQLLTKILQGEGLDTEWTTDSFAGYDLATHNPYDLYVLDVRMPGLLGTELVEGVKADYPHAKILLISSFADAELRQTAEDLGVVILSKPFTPEQFLGEVTKVLHS